MGVQGRGNQSEVDELREQVRGMQMQIDDLERLTQASTEGPGSNIDCGARTAGPSGRQRGAANRRNRRRRPPSESDDSEEVPEYGLLLCSCVDFGGEC